MKNSILFSDHLIEEDRAEIRKLQGPILITGVSGFIGAKLFITLRKYRDDVYGISRQTDRNWRLLQLDSSCHKYLSNLDITDTKKLNEFIKRLKPRTVFNLSAYGAYERQRDVHLIHQVNYSGTLNLIAALFETGCHAFVQAGSSSEYGLNCKAPAESDELKPNSDYAASKAAVSLLIKYYGTIQNFPCANLRLYSIYGPWEDRDRLIPKLITHAMASTFPPLVGKAISRDFVYVDDCIRAFVRAALTICNNSPGLSVNIATGVKTSLEEAALITKRIFNLSADPNFGSMPNRKWDLSDWYGDPRLAAEAMDWKFRVPFDEGLKLTADWEKSASETLRFAKVPKISKKVSAIIACYRDDQAIPIMHERLTQMFQSEDIDYEIIFVNDCSPTSDEDAIRKLCNTDARVIGVSHSRNFGSQSAFLSGMEVSSGDAVVLLDGDLQDPPEIISDFIKKWKEGFDIVYGVRNRRVAALYMQVFYKLFYRIFSKMTDFKIPLDAGDFSLIDRKVVEHLIQLPEKDVFLRGLRAWVGFKQTGVPYTRPERMFGTTTNNFMKNIWWAKKAIFSFSVKPLEYVQRMGILIFMVSTALTLFYLVHYLLFPPAEGKGTTTIILLTLTLGGIQLFSISLLGDYLGKVLEEVKNRPRFIRARLLTSTGTIESQAEIGQFIKTVRESGYGKHSG